MLSSDEALPCDRPNLSKDYLAGTIPFDYVPLKEERFYAQNSIEIRLGRPVRELDVVNCEAVVAGEEFRMTACYLRPGRSPSASPSPALSILCANATLARRLPSDH